MDTPDSARIQFELLDDNESINKRIGDYEVDLKWKLGEGAFGSVFKGHHSTTGIGVAVKVVSSDRVKADELESISKAQSSCVVRLLDVLRKEKLTYIIMELCDTDLNAFINSYGKLDEHNLTVLTRCLAEGYLVLHRHGIVHRDVKPQNILLQMDATEFCGHAHANGKVQSPRKAKSQQPRILAAKFADFGCSRVKRDQEGPANCAGTFFYMAPEVGANLVNSYRYDEAVDMWSIGVVLYQAMTGHVPFSEQQLCRLFLRAVDQNYTSYTPPTFDTDRDTGPDTTEPNRLSRKSKNHHCKKLYRELVRRLLQLDPACRLNPIQFHAFAAHDRPSSFLRCLNEGSCSDIQTATATLANKNLTSSVASVRRTASGVFSRLRDVVQGCRM